MKVKLKCLLYLRWLYLTVDYRCFIAYDKFDVSCHVYLGTRQFNPLEVNLSPWNFGCI